MIKNLPLSITEYLRSRDHDVLDVAGSALRGSADNVLWSRAAEEGRVIITRDLDFPFPGQKPFPHGVILLRVPPNFTAGRIRELFKKSFAKLDLDTFKNHVAVFSPGRIRIGPLR